jgi:predicted dithiol-disulfide oxidoreductase (DUF899 family)
MTATPAIVDRETWEDQIEALRVREKAHTREGDAIAAARRRLPMVEVDPATPVVGAAGEVPLIDSFEGGSQWFASYHMWHTGFPAADQCEGCTLNTGHVLELFREVRDEDRQDRVPGRPISQWSRLAADRSDDLGSTAVATDTDHCH